MAYNNTAGLIQVRDQVASPKVWVSIPMSCIKYEDYSVTPDQMIDLDSYVAETGVLVRTVLDHTRTKVEFTTPIITNTEWQTVWNIIVRGFKSAKERRVAVRYFDPLTNDYKIMKNAYVPDIEFPVRHIDKANVEIQYSGVRVAFIEY